MANVHVYLVVNNAYSSLKNSEAHVFTNLVQAKTLCSVMEAPTAWEWFDGWCIPNIAIKENEELKDYEKDTTFLPWDMLTLAYKQGNWHTTRRKYDKEKIEWSKNFYGRN